MLKVIIFDFELNKGRSLSILNFEFRCNPRYFKLVSPKLLEIKKQTFH